VDGCGLIHSLNALDGSSSHAFDWSEAIPGIPRAQDLYRRLRTYTAGSGLIPQAQDSYSRRRHLLDALQAIAGSLPENEDPRTFLVNARGVLPGGMFSSEPMSKPTPISCTH
jgi:hypothetical protein